MIDLLDDLMYNICVDVIGFVVEKLVGAIEMIEIVETIQ